MILACMLLLFLAVLLSMGFGAVPIGPAGILRGLAESGTAENRILLHVRLPRTLAAVLAGAGLAASGVVMQAVLANPLASPGIIGVNAGAGLGAVLCGALIPGAVPLVPLAAFIGALCAVLLVYGISARAGAARVTLILSGVAVSSLMTAGINTVTTFVPDAVTGARAFQIGGLSSVSPRILLPAGCFIAVSILLLCLMGRELDILGLGESTALSLGLDTARYRFIFLVLAAALAGAAVSFAGLIGFVGLIIPHAGRLVVGNDSRPLLIVSALAGAAFLTICDTVAKTAFSPYELPVGILAAFLGTPFFLWLLFRAGRAQ
ncbi:corrinoid ABC transporter permease [Clostridia bacterium]|nr:corrinoid ABC transporter permease [Clostridia bacterium]